MGTIYCKATKVKRKVYDEKSTTEKAKWGKWFETSF